MIRLILALPRLAVIAVLVVALAATALPFLVTVILLRVAVDYTN